MGRRRCPRCSCWHRSNFKLCAECLEYFRDRARALKIEVFEAYGGAFCCLCGEKRLAALTIDHIGGGGADHRESLGDRRKGGLPVYRDLRRRGFPAGFRVLCSNCNLCEHHGTP